MPPEIAFATPGRDRKSRRRSCRGRGVGRLRITYEASNKADDKSAAESVEGRRPVGRKVSSDACSVCLR